MSKDSVMHTQGACQAACPDEQDLAAYLDGRLSPEERDRFKAHLDQCAACREAVAELGALLGIELPDAPDEVKRRAKGLRNP
ncbi:MAG: zf-HC2 domain-containing protein [Desulfocurvibacter africanus]